MVAFDKGLPAKAVHPIQRWQRGCGCVIYAGKRGDEEEPVVRILLGLVLAGSLAASSFAGFALAQDSQGPLGGFKHDRTAPIDITANALEVRQADQLAIFTGEVVAGQDTLRLTADRVEVTFDEEAESNDDTGSIKNLQAKGNVFLSNGAETAQGSWAEYDVETGMVRMGGDVILTQGGSAGSGDTLVINLNTGVAKMEGSGKNRVSLSLVRTSAPKKADPGKCTQKQIDGARALNISDYKCGPLDTN